uniref:Uncharacterized protein n=1 Tax=Rhipiliopsis peltata TaxID=2320810 RepID=A0A386B1E3_9CHLO|nr:hypothetical protein [Rhipiliopsis peltata]AYC65507.1 hypothetical protein [Rhipiliopsis peltata]
MKQRQPIQQYSSESRMNISLGLVQVVEVQRSPICKAFRIAVSVAVKYIFLSKSNPARDWRTEVAELRQELHQEILHGKWEKKWVMNVGRLYFICGASPEKARDFE